MAMKPSVSSTELGDLTSSSFTTPRSLGFQSGTPASSSWSASSAGLTRQDATASTTTSLVEYPLPRTILSFVSLAPSVDTTSSSTLSTSTWCTLEIGQPLRLLWIEFLLEGFIQQIKALDQAQVALPELVWHPQGLHVQDQVYHVPSTTAPTTTALQHTYWVDLTGTALYVNVPTSSGNKKVNATTASAQMTAIMTTWLQNWTDAIFAPTTTNSGGGGGGLPLLLSRMHQQTGSEVLHQAQDLSIQTNSNASIPAEAVTYTTQTAAQPIGKPSTPQASPSASTTANADQHHRKVVTWLLTVVLALTVATIVAALWIHRGGRGGGAGIRACCRWRGNNLRRLSAVPKADPRGHSGNPGIWAPSSVIPSSAKSSSWGLRRYADSNQAGASGGFPRLEDSLASGGPYHDDPAFLALDGSMGRSEPYDEEAMQAIQDADAYLAQHRPDLLFSSNQQLQQQQSNFLLSSNHVPEEDNELAVVHRRTPVWAFSSQLFRRWFGGASPPRGSFPHQDDWQNPSPKGPYRDRETQPGDVNDEYDYQYNGHHPEDVELWAYPPYDSEYQTQPLACDEDPTAYPFTYRDFPRHDGTPCLIYSQDGSSATTPKNSSGAIPPPPVQLAAPQPHHEEGIEAIDALTEQDDIFLSNAEFRRHFAALSNDNSYEEDESQNGAKKPNSFQAGADDDDGLVQTPGFTHKLERLVEMRHRHYHKESIMEKARVSRRRERAAVEAKERELKLRRHEMELDVSEIEAQLTPRSLSRKSYPKQTQGAAPAPLPPSAHDTRSHRVILSDSQFFGSANDRLDLATAVDKKSGGRKENGRVENNPFKVADRVAMAKRPSEGNLMSAGERPPVSPPSHTRVGSAGGHDPPKVASPPPRRGREEKAPHRRSHRRSLSHGTDALEEKKSDSGNADDVMTFGIAAYTNFV